MKWVYGILILCAVQERIYAQKLPMTLYTASDGLASTFISSVMCDSRGFVWFSTRSGITRFDGEQFVTYGQDDGLTDATVQSMSEMGDGLYWVALNNGTSCRFQPSLYQFASRRSPAGSKPMFEPLSLQADSQTFSVDVVYKNSRGDVFIGGEGSFLTGKSSAEKFRRIRLPIAQNAPFKAVTCFTSDAEGTLWVGTSSGVFRCLPTGQFIRYPISPHKQLDWVSSLCIDRDGRLWIGHTSGGIFVIVPEPAGEVKTTQTRLWRFSTLWLDEQKGELENIRLPQNPSEGVRIRLKSRETKIATTGIYETRDGRIWMGTEHGLLVLDGRRLTLWTESKGFPRGVYYRFAEDHFGNLWIGTSNGAVKVELNGLVKFVSSDGIEGETIHSLYQDREGRIVAVGGKWYLNYYDGNKFASYRSRYLEKAEYAWASCGGFLDKKDEWWFLTNQGLWHFPRPTTLSAISAQRPLNFFSRAEGYDFTGSFCQYEDRTGTLWISLRGTPAERNGLLRWDRVTQRFTPCTAAQGLPPIRSADAFCEDSSGGIWFGFYQGGIARFYRDAFHYYSSRDGIPGGMITSLLTDRDGNLWIGSNEHGVARIDNPSDTVFHIRRYTTDEGLSSNNVRCIVDDQFGRLYMGTARGLDRLDQATGRTKHYGAEDGLPAEFLTAALRDRSNTLWFGTFSGVARMNPEPPASGPLSPPVFLSEIQIAGVSQQLSPLGEQSVSGIVLQPNQTNVLIGFFSVGRGVGEVIRYQYTLKGAQDGWSNPIQERTVHFANLSPGEYEFQVRAMGSDGDASPVPARISFTILEPLAMRWWFRSLLAVVILAAGYGAYRYRLSTVLRLEGLRLRIASDLHDDVGSALTKIAIHSEIMQTSSDLNRVRSSSRLVGALSREVIRTFSDIVWSIDTRHDTFGELTARMKSFALDVLSPRDIGIEFSFSGFDQSEKVSVELRQNLYLIFKEAINNIVRHSSASNVTMELRKMDHSLRLRIRDNGNGFLREKTEMGHGLKNIEMRTKFLQGSLEVENHDGCTITVLVRTI